MLFVGCINLISIWCKPVVLRLFFRDGVKRGLEGGSGEPWRHLIYPLLSNLFLTPCKQCHHWHMTQPDGIEAESSTICICCKSGPPWLDPASSLRRSYACMSHIIQRFRKTRYSSLLTVTAVARCRAYGTSSFKMPLKPWSLCTIYMCVLMCAIGRFKSRHRGNTLTCKNDDMKLFFSMSTIAVTASKGASLAQPSRLGGPRWTPRSRSEWPRRWLVSLWKRGLQPNLKFWYERFQSFDVLEDNLTWKICCASAWAPLWDEI
jgi:hypothetical protein